MTIKEQICQTAWRLNFGELILTQMGKTVEALQQQIDMAMPEDLRAHYERKPYLSFAYFMAISGGQVSDEASAAAFELDLDARLAQLPSAEIQLLPDGKLKARMAVTQYSGAWQLFGDSRLVITVFESSPLRVNLAVPAGWTIDGNQIKGELVEGFKAALPLALPDKYAQKMPQTWRLELAKITDDRAVVLTLPNESGEQITMHLHKV
jgi:hypothetical protein